MDAITIYHGSPNIVTPIYEGGKPYNDYGSGFYCTESLELSKEWACSHDSDGYANQYTLNPEGLSVLNLNGPEFNILNWLAILLDNRKFTIADGLPVEAKRYILNNFLPEYKSFDLIKGYRADDSYFSYANDFINNSLSLSDLKKAMMLGKLGEQIVLKSRRAFDAVTPVGTIPAERNEYYARYCRRDSEARLKYREIAAHSFSPDEIYVIDLIRGNVKNGDARL
ncbi:MAG: DUF3990 domain-containing protein [Bacteroidales bacterium]|nr:DUF3990 domain-containing protein [Candidatus Cacconaster scatequi]